MKLNTNQWLWSAIAATCLTSAASAQTPFTDDFNAYTVGSQLHGQNGWHEWDGVLHAGVSKVENGTTGFARSGNSLSVTSINATYAGTSDMVHEFTGYLNTSGQHTMRVYTYCPTGNLEKWYFIVMNTYSVPGPYEWSVQLTMDPAALVWTCDAGATTPAQGPLLMDQWVELTAQIDLGANLGEVFYNGVSCAPPYSWTAGVFGASTLGVLNIAAVDLYHAVLGAGADNRAYYDDFGLTPGFPPAPPTNFCVAKVSSQGCAPIMGFSGFSSASAGSGFTLTAGPAINNKPGLFLYSDGGQVNVPFFGGSRCVGNPPANPVRRSVPINTAGDPPPNNCSGQFTMDWNTFSSGGLGGTPQAYLLVPGTVVQVQAWGRDPGFPAGFNAMLSDGLEYTVGN